MAIVLAFSGGLDTSFCVPYLKEQHSEPVYTVTVNTGGISEADAAELDRKSKALGAEKHFTVDARADLFDDLISYLIKGNVLRGNVYPLCVGPERVIQARKTVEVARELDARAVGHGSTGAGNDQIRFDVALRLLAGDLEILTPIRDLGWDRDRTSAYLRERGFEIPQKTTEYSINKGLWGTTIGGKETHATESPLPEEAWPETTAPSGAPPEGLVLKIGFEKGVPVSIDGSRMEPVPLVERLNATGAAHGVGRGMHVGDTILGIKGRVAFEAPAAAILIPAHRELEKIVLTKWQRFQKDHLADFYGMMVHEGQYFDPVMRDIEALLDSSQEVVSGSATARLHRGNVDVEGVSSSFSMFNTGVATYGETNQLWDGRDARGFTRIVGVQSILAHEARKQGHSKGN